MVKNEPRLYTLIFVTSGDNKQGKKKKRFRDIKINGKNETNVFQIVRVSHTSEKIIYFGLIDENK